MRCLFLEPVRWLGQSHRTAHQLSPNVNPLDTAREQNKHWAEFTCVNTKEERTGKESHCVNTVDECTVQKSHCVNTVDECTVQKSHCVNTVEGKHWVEITLCQYRQRRHWAEITLCHHHRRHSRRGITKNVQSLKISLDCRRQDQCTSSFIDIGHDVSRMHVKAVM